MAKTEQPTKIIYRVYWNYATKTGKINKTRAAQCSTVEAETPEAAAEIITARGRIVAEVREEEA